MSIRYTCGCGAAIRLPHTAAGRKARCKSCGAVFSVPRQAASDAASPTPAPPARGAGDPTPERTSPPPEPGAWLDTQARAEPQAAGEHDPQLLEIAEPEDAERRRTGPAPRAEFEETQAYAPDNGVWILTPQNSFWSDLAMSFLFFLEPANLIAFLALVVVKLLMACIPLFGCYGLVVIIGVEAYIYAFLMAIVRETAAGEDQFPTVWISSLWDDLLLPLVQYLGTWLIVLLPAIMLAAPVWWEAGWFHRETLSLATAWQGDGWARAAAIAWLLGHFLWPAVVLTVAIGGTFAGLWPHTIVRTAMCAPLGYVAVCAAIIVAGVLSSLPTDPRFLKALGPGTPLSGFSLRAVSTVLGLYSSMVAMRVIGLYYRHYKRQLPWVAE